MMLRTLLFAAVGFASCVLAAGPPSGLDVLRDEGSADGFTRASGFREFRFPFDHGPHPQFRHEWWYLTGNLDSAHGERFGFELTFFRFAVAPRGTAEAHLHSSAGHTGPQGADEDAPSLWRADQLFMAHFAVTDVAGRRFQSAQKYSREALGLAGARVDPLRVWIDDWSLQSDESLPPADWKLHARGADYELTLLAQPLMAPVLNGEHGLSRKADDPGASSYYYSIPRIAVSGQLLKDGVATAVHGLAWLDREWGSGSLGSAQRGWDWFALQLGDGSTLMFYSLRNRDGTRDPHSAGTWVDASGQSRALSNDDVRIQSDAHWDSPRGGRYPARWRLTVPVLGLEASVRPVLPDQELDSRPRYWEGAVDVSATLRGRDSLGRGYVELVGYGE